jgi:hypothetical protein
MFQSGLMTLVLHIRINEEKTASAFMFPFRDKSFLITARHVLSGDPIHQFDIFQRREWVNVSKDIGKGIFPENKSVDIGAVRVPEVIDVDKASEIVTYGKGTTFLGDDAYFIGYPYGISYSQVVETDRGDLPATLPLLKKGCISGGLEDTGGNTIGFFIDGHNNPGFSGGPCIAKKHEKNDRRWNIFGVMSGYLPEWRELKNDGESQRIMENSGICICHNIGFIVSAIESAYDIV